MESCFTRGPAAGTQEKQDTGRYIVEQLDRLSASQPWPSVVLRLQYGSSFVGVVVVTQKRKEGRNGGGDTPEPAASGGEETKQQGNDAAGVHIEYAAAFSPAEGLQKSVWVRSEHHVFDLATKLMMQAAGQFHEEESLLGNAREQGWALERFLIWLKQYDTLFKRPCARCGKLLAVDPTWCILLPPVVQPVQLGVSLKSSGCGPAYHFHCWDDR
ncbi:hypothetical protein CYMTET_53202 [Cymbomonas tetramitiformis]|uniref:Uncharacterized protein n=1 Tax=Cymbomonas tetramitiformis TaxID=36881 RepID=A0AAE0BIL3_9CHLO|nr:hypothetical protein CYMTET_53202 [Cymbomonas tetramitiformis]